MRPRLILLVIGLLLAGVTTGARAQSLPNQAAGHACAASIAPEPRRECLAAADAAMTGALAAVRARSMQAVAGWDGNLEAGDRAEWTTSLGKVLDLWLALRERLCSPQLIGRERRMAAAAVEIAALDCRLSIGAVIVADLDHRFGGEGGVPRASFTAGGRGTNRREVIAAEGAQPLCRHPGRGGDYQPLTACYERHVVRLDRELAALLTAVLGAIGRRADLAPAERADWSAQAVALQDIWRNLRDKTCALEAYETPNRFANSIYSGIVGPCLVVETEARIRWLRTRYRLQ
ncbi:lysozyme inhibitor LprI family protein [Phreatobacter sp. HK31-P]